jgi:hypothetical protein
MRRRRYPNALQSVNFICGLAVLDRWWILDAAEAYFDAYVAKIRRDDPQRWSADIQT